MSEHPTPEHIMEVGLGFWASKTLLSAVEMELFTELARHPEKARRSVNASAFIRARLGILFLDKRKPSYLGGILKMANHRLYGFWGHLSRPEMPLMRQLSNPSCGS